MELEFKVADLLEVLKKNRENHKQIYLDAFDGYRKKVLETMESNLAEMKRGGEVRLAIMLTVPINQTREYDRIIKMLEMTTAKEIELTEIQFSNYVMDVWDWTERFTTSNAMYTSRR